MNLKKFTQDFQMRNTITSDNFGLCYETSKNVKTYTLLSR